MSMFVNKEQLLRFMLTTNIGNQPGMQMIRLSHYDYKFMANLQNFIQTKNQITSNQAQLFDYLISKYKKQLAQQNLDKDQLKKLPWLCEVIESLPKFTRARVSYDSIENLLTIELPYKKEFVAVFKSAYEHNPWVWNRDSRRYEAPVSTYALMLAEEVLPKYFPLVFEGTVKDTIDEIVQLRGTQKYWTPTYVKQGKTFTVEASNPVLDEQLESITLDDSPKTLFALSQLGVDIDESVHNHHPKLLFCSQYRTDYTISKPTEDFSRIFSWADEIGIQEVIVPKGVHDNEINKAVMDASNKYNVGLTTTRSTISSDRIHMQLKFSRSPHHDNISNSPSKIVHIINQKEIKLD